MERKEYFFIHPIEFFKYLILTFIVAMSFPGIILSFLVYSEDIDIFTDIKFHTQLIEISSYVALITIIIAIVITFFHPVVIARTRIRIYPPGRNEYGGRTSGGFKWEWVPYEHIQSLKARKHFGCFKHLHFYDVDGEFLGSVPYISSIKLSQKIMKYAGPEHSLTQFLQSKDKEFSGPKFRDLLD